MVQTSGSRFSGLSSESLSPLAYRGAGTCYLKKKKKKSTSQAALIYIQI